jgi:hypothetical protein
MDQPGPHNEEPYERTGGPIHGWFGLTYANFLVWPRAYLQSMPVEWQLRLVALAEELDAAYANAPHPEAYKVDAAEEHELNSLTPAQLAILRITTEEGPCPEDHDHGANDGADCWSETIYTDDDGREMTGSECVLVPVRDPVPHYWRGRTYVPPDEQAIAAARQARAARAEQARLPL